MHILGLGAAALLLAALPLDAQTLKRDVDLKAADGTLLKATYFAAAKPGPGIVLLHMCNSQRTAWTNLAGQLAGKGFHTITVDYRGYGDSGGERQDNLQPSDRQRIAQQLWPGDFDAVFDFLVAQPGVDRARIGAAGGSCGVDNAIQLARRHAEVKTLVLLAGGTTAAGEDFLTRSPWMPILAVAAHDDGRAVETMRWVLGFSGGSGNRLKEYPSGGHGTDLFPVHKDLEPEIVGWFQQHLVKSPVQASASATPQPGPSAQQSADLRQPGGGARVLAKWRDAKKAGKTMAIAPEGAINALGYEYLQGGRVPDATQLFELNVEVYPTSANTFDSLSDAYLEAGNKAKALEFAKKALAALPGDTSAPDAFKQQIRDSAEGKIRKLGGS